MTNEELEKKINKAFSDAVPEVFDRVIHEIDMKQGRLPEIVESRHCLSEDKKDADTHDCAADQNDINAGIQKKSVPGVTFTRRKERKKGRLLKGIFIAAAAAAVAVGTVFGMSTLNAANAVASTVSLDVNPGLEIKLNKDKKVLDVIPGSEEAKEIIGNMDLRGADLDVAVKALLASMISKGYISDITNSILVSVDQEDKEAALALQDVLMSEIDGIIGNDRISGAVIGQVIDSDEELAEKAKKYGITASKAQLIKQITAQNPTLKFEELVSLNINELNLLKQDDTSNLRSIGTASERAYIGSEKALDIALEYSGFSRDDVEFVRTSMDYENDALCYVVCFYKAEDDLDFDYDFDIDAVSGEIISKEKELKKKENAVKHDPSNDYLSPDDAKALALELAGVDEADIFEYEMEMDYNRGADHYDIEFKSGGKEYDYCICMYGGRVIKDKWELENESVPYDDAHSLPGEYEKNLYIGDEAAKEISLKSAGVSEKDTFDMEIEIEREKGGFVYEVEFKSGIYAYSYDLEPMTGEIVDYEIDFNV